MMIKTPTGAGTRPLQHPPQPGQPLSPPIKTRARGSEKGGCRWRPPARRCGCVAVAASVSPGGHAPRGSPGTRVAGNPPHSRSCTPRGAGSPGSSQEPRTVGGSRQVFLGTEMGAAFPWAPPLLGTQTSMLETPCVHPELFPLTGTACTLTRTCTPMRTHTHAQGTHAHTRALISTHTHMQAHMHALMHVHTHMHTHIHTLTHAHTCTYTQHAHTCTHMLTRHVRAHTHTHALTYMLRHTHTHSCAHTHRHQPPNHNYMFLRSGLR